MKRKQGFSLFLTSCVPGCGQMHQGYMKRGISLTLSACLVFTLAMFLYLDYLLVFLIPLWLFSFFDSYNLRNLADQGMAAADKWPFEIFQIDSDRLSALCRGRYSIIGWALVVLGVYILFDTFVGRAMHLLCEWMGDWWLYDVVMRDLPRMVVTVFIIALGIWFIRGPKQPKTEEIPIFTPPAAEATQEELHGEK